MNLIQKGILTLVKSAIDGKAYSLPEGFQLSAAQKTIADHEILALVYYGAANSLGVGHPDTVGLFDECCKGILVNERQQFALGELYAAFQKNGIDYMPLKGSVIKNMYPNAEMRRMGDADILIRENQYDAIKAVLGELGFVFDYETDHEIVWKSHAIELELHKKLVPERDIEFFKYFGTGWDFAEAIEGEPYRYALSPEMQFVFIFAHMAKHYRSGGIGLTHFIDLWVYNRHYPDMDQSVILKALEGLYLKEFYINVMQTLDVWFGQKEPNEITDFITNVVFQSGVLGSNEAKILSLTAKQLKRENKARRSKLGKILRLVFPPVANLSVKYPVLKKAKAVLPVVWVIRWFDVLFVQKGKFGQTSKKMQLLSEENLTDFEKSLQFVGIEYHFKGE